MYTKKLFSHTLFSFMVFMGLFAFSDIAHAVFPFTSISDTIGSIDNPRTWPRPGNVSNLLVCGNGAEAEFKATCSGTTLKILSTSGRPLSRQSSNHPYCAPPAPIQGICGSTLNNCTSGTFQDQADTTASNNWNCAGSNGGVTAVCSILNLPTVTLSASPTSVAYGAASTLTWSSTNATSCTASDAWSGAKAVSGSQSTGALTTTPNTYTLTCTGTGGTVAQSVTVTIPAPTLTFSISPTTVAYVGASTLTWSSTNVTSCSASGAWSGSKAVSGSQSTGAIITTPNTYTLTCTGPGGTVTRSATVTIPAPTATLQVRVNGGAWTTTAQTIEPTDTINLQWGSTNASVCNASGFSTAGATSGIATSVTEPGSGNTTTYLVQCPGATGTSPATDSVSVTTRSRKPTLTPNDTIVASGATTMMGYDLNGNPSCTFSTTDSTLNNVTVTTNGAKTTGAITQQTAYTLTCAGGNASVIINIEGNIQER